MALMKQNFRIHLHSFYAKKIAQMQVSLNTSIQRVEKKLSTLHIHCQLILDKVAKKAQREEIISSTNGIGKV